MQRNLPKKERFKRPTDSWALMKIHENVDAIGTDLSIDD
jgi:hypothetical protein